MNKFAILTAIGIFAGLSLPSTVHGQLIGPLEYLCFNTATTTATGDCANKDSPFKNESFSYFHLKNFEDQVVDAPGVTFTANCGTPPPAFGCPFISVFGFIPEATDSVDEDDGAIDGSGATTPGGRGQAIWARGNPGIEFSFDATDLGGSLPTHAGIVWTDGSGTWTFEAFDAVGASMGTITAALGDETFLGTTKDDRFFGAINPAGISKIKIMNPGGGGIEVDHLQYGLAGPPTGPSCRIEPRNTFLPLHFLEPHLFNPIAHPPHELGVAVTLGGAPAANVDLSLVATKPVFPDSSGDPSLTETTVQTDTDGRAVFEYIPPSQEPFDRTDFKATGFVNEVSFDCLGSVITGVGALTASFQGVSDLQDSVALLQRVWDKLLARAALDRDSAELSLEFSKQAKQVARADASFLSLLRESVKEHRPLLERIAAGEPVAVSTNALDDMEALLGHLEAEEDSRLHKAILQVKGYLTNARRRAKFAGRTSPPSSQEQRTRAAAQQTKRQETMATARPRIRAAHHKLRLSFEANKGQAAGDVRYLARGPGYDVYLLPQEAVLVSGLKSRGPIGPPSIVRLRLIGTEPLSVVKGLDQLPGKSHYLLGSDPANWRTDVPHFAKVKYEGIYPGVDLVYYGKQHQLEYDFVVAPGANPGRISFGFEGVQGLQLDNRGDLVLNLGREHFRLKKPFIYQEIDGVRQEIAGHYALQEGDLVGFEVGAYDSSRPLVIDPILSYASYAGGGNYDAGAAIAVGPDGSAFVAGATTSLNFPTQNPLQPGSADATPLGVDAFVMKIDPSGTDVIYSTYVGGSDVDLAMGIAVDSAGNAYVTGSTRSADLPIVGAVQTALVGAGGIQAPSSLRPDPSIKDAIRQRAGVHPRNLWAWNYFYERLTGGRAPDPFQLVPSKPGGGQWTIEEVKTYRLGLDEWWDLVTRPPGARLGDTLPELGARSAFVMKLNPTGSALTYSTYLGGSGDDRATSIDIDAEGNVYVAGATSSLDFPVKNAIQESHGGGEPFYPFDAFVAKLNAAGTEIVYATYLGGSEFDGARGVAVDDTGNAYLAGATDSPDFPTTPGAFQPDGPEVDENYEAFVVKLDADGSALLYSTLLGGESDDWGFSLAVDNEGNAHVTGITGSTDFPLLNAIQPGFGSDDLLGFDAFVTKLNADGSELLYSTYLGGAGIEIGYGIAVDSDGNTYVVGETDSTDFPTMGALQAANAGLSDGFVVKLGPMGSTADYSTYLGGSDYDSLQAVALNGSHDVYVTGLSLSIDSPATFGAFQTSSEGLADVLVAKIEPGTPPPMLTTVSAASFAALDVAAAISSRVLRQSSGEFGAAPDSIAAGFGEGLATGIVGAPELPLPTSLGGTVVRITDSEGAEHLAQLFFVAPGQINYLIPKDAAPGLALVIVEIDGQEVARGTVRIHAVAPGLFTANVSGQGVAAALALHVAADLTQTSRLIFDDTAPLGSREALPIDLGSEEEQVFLVLFGTGMRGFTTEATATVGGEAVAVADLLAQPDFVGLDQANLGPLPRSLIGRGEVNILLTVDGKTANTVTVNIQ